ncbi:flavin-containing monooxygenase FMO GS-OX5-like isoform X1 [Rhododendron vialii]|uniref:flavin-containing monooxygenase FMO GS-OX5-like isoform X1 n=1 Tax=Rhododendron vialii TaxID=182163 RepID=UPI00265FE570|nr:flavin-containing monooxygenase FMO GS-OX5-like isoform X1 [Rhododendron vialii]
MEISLKVAIIGAGVSGLVTARELLREGHRVVVYEKSNQPGGTWVYDPRVESDPLGLDPKREIVDSSLYSSLRTNLPRHLMGLSDYSFTDRVYGDPRNFPGHEEVLKFVKDFAREFGLTELIRFETEVVRVERFDSGDDDEWVVESRTSGASGEEEFQAVVVCTGHYAETVVANLPGIEQWPGKQLHSHNYRVPDPFQNQVVVIIGSGPSAIDISREIASVAKQVHLSSRSPNVKVSNFDNTWQHSEIYHVYEDGTIEFQDGSRVYADVIIHCTGYKYSFPFLRTNGIVGIDDNRVGPLYKHVFPPQLSPRLSFVGIPYWVIIFAAIELQSKWVARVLSGKAILPSEKEMLVDVEEHYRDTADRGVPKHHTHKVHPHEFEYLDMIADLAGVPPVAERIKEIQKHFFALVLSSGPDTKRYRDEWDPNDI